MKLSSAAAGSVFSLDGRTALVTGASGGLGARFARVLGERGARVVVAGRREEPLAALSLAIEEAGGEVVAVTLDVTDEANVIGAFDVAEAQFGTVDLLVNNAGIAGGGLALDIEIEDWRAVIEVNLNGAFFVAREAARRMVAAGTGGSIVNIASSLGIEVRKGVAAYATSKAAFIQLTRVLALELARYGIRVNAIAPGYFETDMNRDYLASDAGRRMIRQLPQKRVGEHHELDGALLLIASDAGRYMTGQTIVVDGGHALCMP